MTEPSYKIRSADQADEEQLMQLSHMWEIEGCTSGYPAFGPGSDRPGKWFESGYIQIAEAGERIVVGFAAGVVKLGRGQVFCPNGECYLHVHEVYVHLDHRRRGLGEKLVRSLLSVAKADGVHRSLVASSNSNWLDTGRFYERIGYKMLSLEMYL